MHHFAVYKHLYCPRLHHVLPSLGARHKEAARTVMDTLARWKLGRLGNGTPASVCKVTSRWMLPAFGCCTLAATAMLLQQRSHTLHKAAEDRVLSATYVGRSDIKSNMCQSHSTMNTIRISARANQQERIGKVALAKLDTVLLKPGSRPPAESSRDVQKSDLLKKISRKHSARRWCQVLAE